MPELFRETPGIIREIRQQNLEKRRLGMAEAQARESMALRERELGSREKSERVRLKLQVMDDNISRIVQAGQATSDPRVRQELKGQWEAEITKWANDSDTGEYIRNMIKPHEAMLVQKQPELGKIWNPKEQRYEEGAKTIGIPLSESIPEQEAREEIKRKYENLQKTLQAEAAEKKELEAEQRKEQNEIIWMTKGDTKKQVKRKFVPNMEKQGWAEGVPVTTKSESYSSNLMVAAQAAGIDVKKVKAGNMTQEEAVKLATEYSKRFGTQNLIQMLLSGKPAQTLEFDEQGNPKTK